MKKAHKYNKLSKQTCLIPGCDRKIKQRIVDQKSKHTPIICYKCWIDIEKNKPGRSVTFVNKAKRELSRVY